jgi:hypothetical protein
VRLTPLRSILATLSVLSVFHAACAAKSRQQASSSARPCTNLVLFINNNTDSSVRIYRGTKVAGEVHPRSTQTIAIGSPQEVIRAIPVRPEAAIDPATSPGSGSIVFRPGDDPGKGPDRTDALSEGLRVHLTCQE